MLDKESKAIERLKTASEMSLNIYGQPLFLTYSGGKDSDALLLLAQRAEIPFEVCHSLTTADAPQTVYYVRSTFKRLEEKGIKCSFAYGKYKGKTASMWSPLIIALTAGQRWTERTVKVMDNKAVENFRTVREILRSNSKYGCLCNLCFHEPYGFYRVNTPSEAIGKLLKWECGDCSNRDHCEAFHELSKKYTDFILYEEEL